MLKKTIAFALFCCSMNVFARDPVIEIAPTNLSEWAYFNSTATVNDVSIVVNRGLLVSAKKGSIVSLVRVAAMNAEPKIDAACQNIKLQEGEHKLLFELKSDWLVHCIYT